MKPEKWFREKIESLKGHLEFRLEMLTLDLTAKICGRMEQKHINRTQLADRLQVSPAFVTKILNGTSNFTLRTMMSLADALECELSISLTPKEYPTTVQPSEYLTAEQIFREPVSRELEFPKPQIATASEDIEAEFPPLSRKEGLPSLTELAI